MHKRPEEEAILNRRAILRASVVAGLAPSLGRLSSSSEGSSERRQDLILAKNEKTGTTDWLLEKTRVDPKTK